MRKEQELKISIMYPANWGKVIHAPLIITYETFLLQEVRNYKL